ncbi:MAG TPA: hypothetical protein VK904_00160, partial [Miltoncostaeaceae bacterium]|nr:hypothetical protein [Miltoncostaeaceae bacterium]
TALNLDLAFGDARALAPGWAATARAARVGPRRGRGPGRRARGGHRALRRPHGARGRAGPGRPRAGLPLGPPLPEAPAGIRLRFEDDEQRRLAKALGGQERVAILLLDVSGAWLAQVELELGEESRALIADASRGR